LSITGADDSALMLHSLALFFFAAICVGQTNPAFREVEDVPGLPRILLIGDSISIGYTEPVRVELTDKANVHRIPENGAATIVGVKNLDKWLGTLKWDVIHFNFACMTSALDDGKHQVPCRLRNEPTDHRPAPAEDRRAADLGHNHARTGRRSKAARAIPTSSPTTPPQRRIMTESGIPIDDLYELVNPPLPIPACLWLAEAVHRSPSSRVWVTCTCKFQPTSISVCLAISLLGHQVAESVLRALDSH